MSYFLEILSPLPTTSFNGWTDEQQILKIIGEGFLVYGGGILIFLKFFKNFLEICNVFYISVVYNSKGRNFALRRF